MSHPFILPRLDKAIMIVLQYTWIDTTTIHERYTDTNGIQMIEAVERTDKTFALGLQFHPEAAVVKNLDDAGNKGDFMDYDTALSIFQYVLEGLPALEGAA